MLVVPAVNAVTNPVVAFTVATAAFELLQLPPVVPLVLYVAVALMQSGEVPLTVPALHEPTVKVSKEDTGLPQPLFTV